MQNKRVEKKELTILMIAGCLLGILCFGIVYGLKIVNPLYDGWMFGGDMDLKQHYVGFCHFRTTPWHFPIGLIDTLSVPYSMSVVYTDSIPLFAVVFKIFSNLLPLHFQYFGIFGLISFMLMGMLSPVLIRRFCDNKFLCILGSLFFILSFPILHRMYYHTALSAQWIIVLSLIIWSYIDITDTKNLKKLCIYWALIGFIAVSIHSYFVFMSGIVLAAQIIDGIVRLYIIESDLSSNKKISFLKICVQNIYVFIPLVCMGITSFTLLYLLGGFYGKGSVSGLGFGSFNANLSSYFNPLTYGSIFKGFELYGDFEFEGFAYVGAGILLILLAMGVNAIYVRTKKGSNQHPEGSSNNNGSNEQDRIAVSTVWVFVGVIIVVLLASCFPCFSIGSIKLIKFPVPKFLEKVFGICRTNARFVWVGMYIIIASALWFVGSNFKKLWIKILFTLAIIIQLFDLSGLIALKHEKYAKDETFVSVWESLDKEYGLTEGKDEFVFMYGDSDIMMDTAFYAYQHGMSQNSYYYARTIYDEINENIAEWSEKFLAGDISDSVVYVFRDEDYTDEYNKVAKELGANVYRFDGHVAVTR